MLKDVEPTVWRLESKTDENTAKINDIMARLNFSKDVSKNVKLKKLRLIPKVAVIEPKEEPEIRVELKRYSKRFRD